MNNPGTYLVTMQFDAETFAWLQALRTAHFPASLNQVPAHLSLFHRVSLDQVSRLGNCWNEFELSSDLPVRFTGLRSLGRGTAIVVESPRLDALRARAMLAMSGKFSAQDRQTFRAHVTIQNKVQPAAARALLERLTAAFVIREGRGLGLMIWCYLDGPWSLERILPLQCAACDSSLPG